MSHNHNDDRLDELIARAADIGKVEFDRDKWLARLAAEEAQTKPGPHRTIWRTIMDSRITKYSVAATILVVASLVLSDPFGWLGGRHGVALAQVRARVAEVETMILRGQATFTSVTDPNVVVKYDNVKYLSRQEGFVEDGFVKDKLIYRVILSQREKQGLLLLVPWKRCVRFPCPEEQLKAVERLTPSGIVDVLLESNAYQRLGTAEIEGVEAEGFELQNLKPLDNLVPKSLMDLQQGTATVWVGTKELLPIRMEADLLLGKTIATLFMDVRCHKMVALDKYNVELDPGMFKTGIPDGYTEFKLTDLLGMFSRGD